jgi:hypothetical protein
MFSLSAVVSAEIISAVFVAEGYSRYLSVKPENQSIRAMTQGLSKPAAAPVKL